MEFLQITMIRPDMSNIPQHDFPKGYRLRPFGHGDAATWVRVQQLAEPFYTIDQETFEKNFGQDLPAMPERSFFLVAPDGSDVGTITSWYDDDFKGGRVLASFRPGVAPWRDRGEKRWGRIHWVCIVPQHQRKGLCRPMMTAAMNRLKSLGHERAMLGTQTPRLGAIKVYLDLGFLPDLCDDEARRAWLLVKQEMPHQALAGLGWDGGFSLKEAPRAGA
jgi:GNAT superfamily N-acetyltransferase